LFTSSINLHSADVNLSYGINATDAVKLTRRFVGADTSFIRGDWIFEKPFGGDTINVSVYMNDTVIVNGNNVTVNFNGLCVGDVNGSNIPGTGAKGASKVSLDCDKTIELNSDEYFELPLKVTSDINIGAISLIIKYPKELVTDVSCQLAVVNSQFSVNSEAGNLFYKISGNELRIGWFETESTLNLKNNDPVIIIKGKTTRNFKPGDRIKFEIADNSLCELADENGEPLDNIYLKSFSIIHKNSLPISLSDSNINNDMFILPKSF